MPKVIITLTDTPDGESCTSEMVFDPPIRDSKNQSPAQAVGCAICDRLTAMANADPIVTILSGETVTMSQNQFSPCNN